VNQGPPHSRPHEPIIASMPSASRPLFSRKFGSPIRSSAPVDAWRYHDDVGPDGRVVLPAITAAAELVDHQVDVEAPPAEAKPSPNPWTGPTSVKVTGEANGRSKLTSAIVVEVRRLSAEGVSMYALARRYDVAENTIRGTVTGRTWKDA
jgi:hypothetical protein